jgi:hypothetical protein
MNDRARLELVAVAATATNSSLRIFEGARQAIAEAATVDEVKRVLALACGLAAAARQATDHEMEAEAVALKLEAERRLGQLMAAQRATVGLATGGDAARVARDLQDPEHKPTLAQAGITKGLAQRARRAAAMSEPEFETALEAAREAQHVRSRRRTRSTTPARHDAGATSASELALLNTQIDELQAEICRLNGEADDLRIELLRIRAENTALRSETRELRAQLRSAPVGAPAPSGDGLDIPEFLRRTPTTGGRGARS